MTAKHKVSFFDKRVYLVDHSSDSVINWGTYAEMIEQLHQSEGGLDIVDYLDLTTKMKQQTKGK